MLAAYGFGPHSGPFGGTTADLVRVPHATNMLVKLPDGLDPLRVAAAADNLANAWQVVVPFLKQHPEARVLVIGGAAQSIGLFAAGLAVAHGASIVDYLDRDTIRLEMAESFGAHPVRLPELLQWVHDNDFAAERVTTTLADFDDAPTAYATHTTKLVLHRDPLT
jgi:threonine dehydrogenase-like Zn-dependent dehydrogenase